jgi:hypothetical protein
MYGPANNWPSDEIARICHGRPWFVREFTNANYWHTYDYILIKAKFLEIVGSRPRAIHIAYKRVGVADTVWRYYGTVLAIDGYFQLYNESGDYQSMAQQELDKIRFRTYYGGRPVVRRIASLHNFAMESTFPFNAMDIIGFNW